jgi:hypothetical protein
MNSIIIDSLEEVREMKKLANEDFIKSGETSYSKYLSKSIEGIAEKYKIEYFNKKPHNRKVA